MKNYAKFLISLLLMFCFTNCVFAQTEELNSADVNTQQEATVTESAVAEPEVVVVTDNSDTDTTDLNLQTTEPISPEEKSIADKALTPVGWVIGGVIAPVYLGVDFTKDAIEWTVENVVAPIGDGISWSYDYVLKPVGHGVVKGTELTVTGIGWTIDKTVDGAEFICKYTVVPAVKLGIDVTNAGY